MRTIHSGIGRRYHVVGIMRKAYVRLASYGTLGEALDDILERSFKSMVLVLRDGTTGKRYSVSECRALRASSV